jgi:hypothetical protein
MATDPATLTDPQQLRILADNARARGREDLAFTCLVRIAELAGQSYDPGIEREFWEAITVAEELRSAETGRTARLSRTRQKVNRVGVLATVRDLARAPKTTEGFRILVDGKRPDLTAEAIVIRHPEHFDADVIEAAKTKLGEAGVPLALVARVTAGV